LQVEFSPFVDNLIAVGTAQYFGIIGNGKQNVYEMLPSGELLLVRVLLEMDARLQSQC
jgi:peroxin-7